MKNKEPEPIAVYRNVLSFEEISVLNEKDDKIFVCVRNPIYDTESHAKLDTYKFVTDTNNVLVNCVSSWSARYGN